jgi:nucleoside 2-deoxyribosyltransferase
MKIYLAGALFTTAERAFNKQVADRLAAGGHEVLLPQERGPGADATGGEGSDVRVRSMSAREILLKNKRDLDAADAVVAIMDGPDPDSGTAWECGYAYALGKPTVLLRTDIRGVGDLSASPYNAMITGSADVHLELPLASVEEAGAAVLRALDAVQRR